jgi:hypothetical protein
VDTPPPPVHPAPAELRGLAIHVHQLATPRENQQDEWDYHNMPGYTGELRDAFTVQLQAAGYTVIVARHMPADLVATIQAEWPPGRPGVATLVLTDRGEVVERLSVTIPIIGEDYRTEWLEGDAAVALVHAVSRSPKVAEYARRLREQPRTRPVPQVAE